MSHEHYFIDVSGYDRVDVYRLIELLGITCPVAQHVFKKAAATGKRGHKSLARDWQDIADSAARRLQMMDEDLATAKKVGCVPGEQGPCTCPSGDGSLRWPCPVHAIGCEFGQQNTIDYRDPRTVAGVDVSFETEKHMSFAPECEHLYADSGSHQMGSLGQPLTIFRCDHCGDQFVEAEHA